jgi:hypothetical protein
MIEDRIPAEITDIEVARPVSQEKVLLTPVKLKEFIDLHAPSGGTTAPVETFETILNNLRSWTISRTYSSTGALDAESFSKLINGTEQIIQMTYSYSVISGGS